MDTQFWHDRWQANQIGFHSETFHVYLQQFWPQLGLKGGEQVFVPLCGKTMDMLWFLQQGHRVLGVELSPIAVQAFFQENNLAVRRRVVGPFAAWSCDEAELLCGDFFDLTPAQLAEVGAVYDRASLVALPPDMRQRYARQLSNLVPLGVPVLLVTLSYPQAEMNGPPFAVDETEVRRLFDNFDIEVLEQREILDEEPHFKARGLSYFQESAYKLVKRDADSAL